MKTKIWAALLTVYLVWGSTYLGIRFAIETIPPFLHASVRFLISGIFLYTWRRMAGDPAPSARQWFSAFVVGSLLLVGGNGLISLAETGMPSGVAALLVATIPMFMVLVEALRKGGARPNIGQIAGLLIGFSGVAVLIGPAEFGGTRDFDLLFGGVTLVAAFSWSLGSIYSRNADQPKSTLLFTGMQMLMGSIGLIIVSTLKGEPASFNLAAVSSRSIFGLLYLVTFGSLLGFTSYAWLLRNAPVSLVSTYAYVNPIVAVLLGALFVGEKLNARILLAALIIVGSVVLVNLARRPAPKQAESDQTLKAG